MRIFLFAEGGGQRRFVFVAVGGVSRCTTWSIRRGVCGDDLVTAFNGFMAWVQDAELLALYAIAGGFSTPLLLSTGENHEVALFSICCCWIAVLVLVALKPWSRLLCAAFVGTVFFFAEWSLQYYSQSEFGTTAFFLACSS
jgi:uncharacterized membrane protein